MPCIELSTPKLTAEVKSHLADSLTKAFSISTGHPCDILGIRFFEYENDTASIGGKLCNHTSTIPYLHMVVYCPRLKRSIKKAMGSALTEAFLVSVKNPNWVPTIHICEHPYDNIVVKGKLLTDAFEECSKRKFYYELPQD